MTEARGELETALRPLVRGIEGMRRFVAWPLGLLVLAYLGSGITRVQADEVAVVLRFGEVVGEGPARIHGPGLLWAWPRPADEVIRIEVDRVHELAIDDLVLGRATPAPAGDEGFTGEDRIDPRREGYCLTGDQGILHAPIIVRYRIRDPIVWALEQEAPDRLLRSSVVAAMVRSTAEQSIEQLLTDGRRLLSERVKERAQRRLEQHGSGLEIISLELSSLKPPRQVEPTFWDVNDAYIEYSLLQDNARYYRATELPAAEAEARRIVREAEIFSARRLARARGDSAAFVALLREYQEDPVVVRQRLYRETIEQVLEATGDPRYVPPPEGERYTELRITVPKKRR